MMFRRLLGEPQRFDWKVVTITIVSTLLLMIDFYHQLTPAKVVDRIVLYLVVPLLVVVLLFRDDPADYGFSLGDWKAGLALTAAGIVLIAPVLWLTGHGGAMCDYYQSQLGG